MQHEKFVLKFSKKRRGFFLILYFGAVLCFCQTSAAQSGRRVNKGETDSKPSAATSAARSDSVNVKADDKVSSLVVVGHTLEQGALFANSNYIDIAIKECANDLKDYAAQSKSGLTIAKGGKAKFEEAVERAKKETDTHILWLELNVKTDDYGNSYIDYIDYAVLKPRTAKRLTSGRVTPGEPNVAVTGGILRVPRPRRPSPVSQIRSGAREIVNRLVHWDWL
jgi:hypothetical protein